MAVRQAVTLASKGQPAVEMKMRKETNLWRDAWLRLLRNKLAIFGLVVICFFLFLAIFADVIAPYSYEKQQLTKANQFPNPEFWFGTDPLGRDLMSRLIYGARVSMIVGLGSQVVVLLIGVPLGAIAGYYGGKVDLILMRLVDVMYAFPTLLFVILLMTVLGSGMKNIFIAIGLTSWVTICRLTRAQFLSLRQKDFIMAAESTGASSLRLIWRHLLPNALSPIIVAITFGVPTAIFTEAALSFIGVGISPPTPTWGGMVGESQQYLRSYWYMATFPALAIGLTMLSFSFLGDGLRDALDPRMKQ